MYLVVSKFCEIDLHPNVVSNLEMGYLYEELIRRFPSSPTRRLVSISPPAR